MSKITSLPLDPRHSPARNFFESSSFAIKGSRSIDQRKHWTRMMRFLVRLVNNKAYTPKDVKVLQTKIRELLGSADMIGNLRVSTSAIEFDLFAEQSDLNRSRNLLEAKISKVVTLRS